tara:strand:- start:7 stop:813 length:807 start_codon:yes stop_codon:yes gene_type:complete
MESWRQYQRQQFLLENREYITNVLGIALPLNESCPYSANLTEEILKEHLLLENFLGSLALAAKQAAGDAKNFYITIAAVIKDPSKIGEFLGFLNIRVIRAAADKIREMIGVVINIPALQPLAQKINQMLEGAMKKYNSMQTSWVKLLAGLALGAALQFIWNKIGKSWEQIKEQFKGMLTPEGIANLGDQGASLIKTKVLDIVTKLLGQGVVDKAMKKFTDIKSYLGAIGPIVGGVKFFLDVLSPATSAYAPQLAQPFVIGQRKGGTAE